MNQKRRCCLLLAVFSPLASFDSQNSSITKVDRIDQLVSRYEKYGYLNGSILVAEHGKVIYARGVGASV